MSQYHLIQMWSGDGYGWGPWLVQTDEELKVYARDHIFWLESVEEAQFFHGLSFILGFPMELEVQPNYHRKPVGNPHYLGYMRLKRHTHG